MPETQVYSSFQKRFSTFDVRYFTRCPIRIREDLIDEEKKLKVLLAANFGRSKNDESKQRKVAVEYVKLCGYKNGEMGNGRKKEVHNGLPTKLSLDEIASQYLTAR